MTSRTNVRTRNLWLVTGGVVLLALFAAGQVYSLSCDTTNSETLELELQSVERGGESVDDLSAWRQASGEEITTQVTAQYENRVRLVTTTSSDYKSLTFTAKE